MSIVTLTGASGSGKSSYASELITHGWTLVPSSTTRPSRAKDLPGEYEYYSKGDFDILQGEGSFLWTTRQHGHSYGTTRASVISRIATRPPSLMLIDPPSVVELRRELAYRYPSGCDLVSVYLLSPDEAVLRLRLERRKARDGISDHEIERRVAECRAWDTEALASDIPYLFVPGEILIADAARFIARLVDRQLSKGETR